MCLKVVCFEFSKIFISKKSARGLVQGGYLIFDENAYNINMPVYKRVLTSLSAFPARTLSSMTLAAYDFSSI